MVTEEKVMDALRKVYDPEIPVNIVDLGLIYDVAIEDDNVHVRMTMTTRGCPLHHVITSGVKAQLLNVEGVQGAEVELVWDPPWTIDRINPELRRRLAGGR